MVRIRVQGRKMKTGERNHTLNHYYVLHLLTLTTLPCSITKHMGCKVIKIRRIFKQIITCLTAREPLRKISARFTISKMLKFQILHMTKSIHRLPAIEIRIAIIVVLYNLEEVCVVFNWDFTCINNWIKIYHFVTEYGERGRERERQRAGTIESHRMHDVAWWSYHRFHT